ncbi:hypothetical protein [Pontibacter fetidus]|uniref:Uncharacterized protein n=1 Tax=Pontibacter fetidus TaxID=2700082 RepID=A0A6B2H945_9BACT|nr:hypothetical protein [Pontibacter fetidus]NDK56002.1 hypothetical protein [Pontibacter fetidus]
MNYMLKYSLSCLLLVLTLASCRKEPNYPDEPQISFKRVEQYDHDALGVQKDSLFLVIGFQDGDGNLGLSSDDKSEDYNFPFQKGSPYEKNFIIKVLRARPDPNNPGDPVFEELIFPTGTDLSGRFPRISNDDRKEPLEGEIKLALEITNENEQYYAVGDVVKFEVFIYDRTTPVPNKSNVVTSEPITLFTN